jgi:hypothetical protein
MTDTDGLADPVLPARPRSPVGTQVAVDDDRTGEGLPVAGRHQRDQGRLGPQVPGVDDLYSSARCERGQLGAPPFDEAAVRQIPPDDCDATMAEPGEHVGSAIRRAAL